MTKLDPRIHQALDGELPLDTLPPELRAEALRLLDAGAALKAVPAAPAGRLEERVLAALRRRRTLGGRVREWVGRPRVISVRLRPVWALAAAAAVAGVLLVRAGEQPSPAGGTVEFVAPFPHARSVAVAGSFNDWAPESLRLSDGDHDGVWRGSAAVPSGAHEYMFVVDGDRWVADPLAQRYVEDGYGRQNTLLIVQ